MEARKLEWMDTTLRDGEQTSGVSFLPSEKLHIAKALLEELKIDRIEVASARVSAGELEGVQRITQWAAQKGYLDRIEVLGFVDTPMIKGIRHAQLLAVSSELTASVIIRSAMRGKSKVSVPALRNSIWYILRYIRTPTRNRIESIIERCFAFVLKQPADR